MIDDNSKYEDLIDELTLVLRKSCSEQTAAQIEMDRALALMNKGKLKQAYEALIKNSYHIGYSTFNNYLARNAKKELEQLDKQDAQDKQPRLF